MLYFLITKSEVLLDGAQRNVLCTEPARLVIGMCMGFYKYAIVTWQLLTVSEVSPMFRCLGECTCFSSSREKHMQTKLPALCLPISVQASMCERGRGGGGGGRGGRGFGRLGGDLVWKVGRPSGGCQKRGQSHRNSPQPAGLDAAHASPGTAHLQRTMSMNTMVTSDMTAMCPQ